MTTLEELKLWKALVETRIWERLREIAAEQQEQRIMDVINKPAGSPEEIAEQNYLKGEVSGIGLMLRTPLGMIESLTAQYEAELKQQEENDEESTDERASEPSTEFDD